MCVCLSQRAQAALQAVNAVQSGGMGGMPMPGEGAAMGGIGAMGSQSPVLRVIVENLFYPVTLDVLHQVHAHTHPPVTECLSRTHRPSV